MHKFTEPMVATKRLRYNTRMLVAGEHFFAKAKDVRLLKALGKAEERGREIGDLPEPPAGVVQQARRRAPAKKAAGFAAFDPDQNGKPGGSSKPADDAGALKAARAEYTRVTGKRPFPGWGIEELAKRAAS